MAKDNKKAPHGAVFADAHHAGQEHGTKEVTMNKLIVSYKKALESAKSLVDSESAIYDAVDDRCRELYNDIIACRKLVSVLDNKGLSKNLTRRTEKMILELNDLNEVVTDMLQTLFFLDTMQAMNAADEERAEKVD